MVLDEEFTNDMYLTTCGVCGHEEVNCGLVESAAKYICVSCLLTIAVTYMSCINTMDQLIEAKQLQT